MGACKPSRDTAHTQFHGEMDVPLPINFGGNGGTARTNPQHALYHSVSAERLCSQLQGRQNLLAR